MPSTGPSGRIPRIHLALSLSSCMLFPGRLCLLVQRRRRAVCCKAVPPPLYLLSSVGFSLMPLWEVVGKHGADRQSSRDCSATVLGGYTPLAGAALDRAQPG